MRKAFMNGLLKLAMLLIIVTGAMGCASQTVTSATGRAMCSAFRPITWADADTDATIRGVKSHNAAYAAVCR